MASSDSMSHTICLDLNDLTAQIAMALDDTAALIYWHHKLFKFDWLRASDQHLYKDELRNLKGMIKTGVLIGVKAGESLSIQEKTLYPLEIELKNVECYAYMLIRRRGLLEDAENTPYLFVSQSARENAMTFLSDALREKRKQGGGRRGGRKAAGGVGGEGG